jgi:hypothetical protein
LRIKADTPKQIQVSWPSRSEDPGQINELFRGA